MTYANFPVLIVDDSDTARAILCDVVQEESFPCFQSGDPLHVIEAILEHGIRIVLLDMSMPERSGLEVLGDIKAYEQGAAKTLATIVVTGSHDQHVALKAITSGAFMYLNKPVKNNLLIDALKKAVEELEKADAQAAPPAETAAPAPAPSAPPAAATASQADSKDGMTALDKALAHLRKPVNRKNAYGYSKPILVHTASPTTMTVLSDLIIAQGYSVICLPERDKIERVSKKYGVDVFVLDLGEDTSDGLAFLEQLTAPEASETARYVIMLTELSAQQEALMYLRRGAAANVPKPNASERLVPAVERCVQMVAGSAP